MIQKLFIKMLLAYRNSWTLDARVGRCTLDAGLCTLHSGRWKLDSLRWTLDRGPWTLGPGRLVNDDCNF